MISGVFISSRLVVSMCGIAGPAGDAASVDPGRVPGVANLERQRRLLPSQSTRFDDATWPHRCGRWSSGRRRGSVCAPGEAQPPGRCRRRRLPLRRPEAALQSCDSVPWRGRALFAGASFPATSPSGRAPSPSAPSHEPECPSGAAPPPRPRSMRTTGPLDFLLSCMLSCWPAFCGAILSIRRRW